jgi:hypothetical protein
VAIVARRTVVAAGAPAKLSRAGGVKVETATGRRVLAEAGRHDAPRIVRELVAAGGSSTWWFGGWWPDR